MPRPKPLHPTRHVLTHFHSCYGVSGSHYSLYHYFYPTNFMGGAKYRAKIHYRLHHCHLLQNYYMLGKVVPHINGWTTTTFGGTLLT